MEVPIAMGNDTENANTVQLEAFVVYCWRFGMNRKGVGNTQPLVVRFRRFVDIIYKDLNFYNAEEEIFVVRRMP